MCQEKHVVLSWLDGGSLLHFYAITKPDGQPQFAPGPTAPLVNADVGYIYPRALRRRSFLTSHHAEVVIIAV